MCVFLTRLVGIAGRIMKESGSEGLPWGPPNMAKNNSMIMGTIRTMFKTMKWENTMNYVWNMPHEEGNWRVDLSDLHGISAKDLLAWKNQTLHAVREGFRKYQHDKFMHRMQFQKCS